MWNVSKSSRFTGILWTWSGSSSSLLFILLDAKQEGNQMDLERLPETASVIQVPAPTGWPMTAAFGFTLILGGLITHPLVSAFGAVTLVMGLTGWFRAVLPQQAQESVPVEHETGVALKPG